uniref:DUF4124 domain-containing protein n=1 Tax=Ralstonia solanacearum TaxID=305 RepID=A0A0S4WPH6_RALSL|nr:conserved exported protein of unknown function [Ralstonia solanacearum]
MRTILPLLICLAIPTAGAQSINRCKIDGKTVYTDQPCAGSLQHQVERAEPAPQQAPRRMSDAEHNNLGLAEQWDRRMAQRDSDLANEQVAMQYQATVVSNECRDLRARRDQIQRLPLTVQQLDPSRSEMNRIRLRMNQLHC